ncbi:hypothetical protein HJFPF1_05047 [Paramyrothecium foliicola]|nr:hypothetical protein HJFPF1_05047 [Paramyrothecium foliicola]
MSSLLADARSRLQKNTQASAGFSPNPSVTEPATGPAATMTLQQQQQQQQYQAFVESLNASMSNTQSLRLSNKVNNEDISNTMCTQALELLEPCTNPMAHYDIAATTRSCACSDVDTRSNAKVNTEFLNSMTALQTKSMRASSWPRPSEVLLINHTSKSACLFDSASNPYCQSRAKIEPAIIQTDKHKVVKGDLKPSSTI